MAGTYDIFIAGVGGQGILTIAELMLEAAMEQDIPANFYPTKGMAQRGGFVKAQLRLGRENVGPSMPEKSADLIIAMEQSEALKAIRYGKPGANFLLYASVWAPTEVMLGRAPYPELSQVEAEIAKAGLKCKTLLPADLPQFDGRPVRENIYVLGASMKCLAAAGIMTVEDMVDAIGNRWPKAAQANIAAFEAGLAAASAHSCSCE